MTDFRQHPDPIRFNVPSIEGNEMAYIEQSLTARAHVLVRTLQPRAAAILQADSGAQEVMLTTSCTAALELSAMLLDLQPGDTVVVPSFTFSTSALAFASRGAELVFCDIESTTAGDRPPAPRQLLDDRVRAVVVVHYAGVACDIDGIREVLAGRPDVALIEDNAHGLFGGWRGQPLGSFGAFTGLSFHGPRTSPAGRAAPCS